MKPDVAIIIIKIILIKNMFIIVTFIRNGLVEHFFFILNKKTGFLEILKERQLKL
jgi:hypothetical protein